MVATPSTQATSAKSAKTPPTALSPHLQIWRFTVTMAASITHRACGVALYTGSALLAIWLYATAYSPPLYSIISDLIASSIGILALAGFSWALFFHLINGFRHLFWDRGHGFEIETAKRTAWLAYSGATILMVLVMAIGLAKAGGA